MGQAHDAEGDEAEQDNAVQGALRWAFIKTGLQGIAEAVGDNGAVGVSFVILYLASLTASFAAGDSQSFCLSRCLIVLLHLAALVASFALETASPLLLPYYSPPVPLHGQLLVQ